MNLWGLTGGIGSGKSTVAGMFAALGAHVVNADAVYHELLLPTPHGPSPLAQQIATAFDMPQLLRADYTLDRQQLGALVFADAAARHKLEALTHPVIRQTTEAMLQRLPDANALYDVPLLYEKNMQSRFAGVIVVWVPAPVQLQRLIERDRMPRDAAAARIAAQLPLDDKRQLADYVIDNSGPLAQTQQAVATVWQELKSRSSQSSKPRV